MEKWYVTLGNSIAVDDRILYRPVEVESIEEAEANAERIVKAVNCHDELVEALNWAISLNLQQVIMPPLWLGLLTPYLLPR